MKRSPFSLFLSLQFPHSPTPLLKEEKRKNKPRGQRKSKAQTKKPPSNPSTVAGISSKPTWDAPTWAAPLSRSTLTTAFEHYTAPIQALLHTISSHDVWALFDHGGTHAAATYIKGHACIAGDAAHATTPHLGAGAGMAVEDAYVLAGLLGQAAARWKRGTAADKPDPIARALYAYDSVRRGRTQRLVGASREAGEFWGFEVEDVGMDEERLAKRVREMFDWIWSEDVQVELEAGKRIMDEVV